MTAGTEAVAVAQARAARLATENDSIRPFTVQVPEARLQDLRRRIAATQWPEKETVADDKMRQVRRLSSASSTVDRPMTQEKEMHGKLPKRGADR